MSLSRKYIESLIDDEIKKISEEMDFEDDSKLAELCKQIFLIQITNDDIRSAKSSIKDKIDHFYVVMEDKI